LSPDEVVERSQPRGRDEAEAAACFELGRHCYANGDQAGAVRWWREAHRLDPNNWTYKRQAWSIATTPEGEASDLMQGPTEAYVGNWLDDVKGIGGGENYYAAFQP
jgi:Tetratricopeptide repeat